ncbi:MAG TPA: translocation/assembly module TamB domain-containing protein [Polyangiaceae bacterium]|nr:translocation/assembly module TamB domain-containing protein [Polyangiaceae bacterium]
MTPARPFRRALRALALCLCGLLVTLLVLGAGAGLYLSSARGRDRLLRALVTELNQVLPGRITVRRIERLGPSSVVLKGVVLTAPAGNEVLAAETVRAEIALRSLLRGRVVLPLAVLENGEADLRQLTQPGAGLISALSVPSTGPSAPQPPGAEPFFEIGALSLRDWRVHLPRAGPWTPSEVGLRSLQAGIRVGSAVEVEVEHLDAELRRDAVPIGVVAVRGHWSSHADSALQLAGTLCETELVLELKLGRFPNGAADWRDVPVDLRWQQRALSAARIGELALQPRLEPLFLGTLDARARVQGTARRLRAHGELRLDAGQVAFAAEARELSELDLTLDTEQLELNRLFSGAPEWQLGTHTRASLELAHGQAALGLKLSSQNVLNQIALPQLELRAQLEADALRQLELQLDDRWLALSARGDLGFDGSARLNGRARVDLAGAPRWLRAFAPGGALEAELRAVHGSVNVELGLRRLRSGALSARGQLRSEALELAGARFEQLRAALSFAGALPRPVVGLDASWAAASRGAIALTPGELHLTGGPRRYEFRLKTGSLSFGSGVLSGWLEPAVRESRFLLAGSGEFRGARWRLSMLPASSAGARQLTVPELRLVFADQELRLHGGLSPGACDLELEFARVDLQRLLTPLAPRLARAGLLSGKLQARGSPEHPELELQLRGDALELAPGTRLDADLSARLDAADDTLELRARLRDDAGATPSLDLVWRLREPAGQLDTELALQDAAGPWLHARGMLALPIARARPSFLQRLAALPALLPRALEHESWQLELSAAPRPLANLPLPASWSGLGQSELDARLVARHAPGLQPQAELELHLADAHPRARPGSCAGAAFSSDGSLRLRDGRFEAALAISSERSPLLHVSGSGALDVFALLRGGERHWPNATLELEARDLPLSRLPVLCERARGQLTVSGSVRDPFGQGQSELQMTLREFSLGSDQTVDVAGRLRASRGALDWDGTLRSGEHRSRFSGELRRAGAREAGAATPLAVVLTLDQLPLAPFFPLQGPLSHISGSLSGELRARGAQPSPELSGSLQLHDVSFTVTELAQPLSDINGELRLEQNALVLHQLTARDTNGSLTLDGRFALRGPRELEAGLELTADKFPLRQAGQAIATTSAQARIDLGWKPEQQDFRIRLLDMDIWLESDRAPAGLSLEPHPDVSVRQARAPGPNLVALAEEERARAGADHPNRTTVQIQSQDGFWVRRADFDLKLATDLKIAIERPAPSANSSGVSVTGEIRFERGYLELLGKMFEVRSGGTLRFPGSTATTLDLVASYKDRRTEKTVTVRLRGTLSAPKLDFTLDDEPITAGEAFQAIYGSTDNSSDRVEDTEAEASQILSALTAGLITTSIRRRLGAMAPIVAVDPGGSQGVSQVRAGFELDTLIPDFLRDVVTGVYVEGILSSEKLDQQGTQRDVQPGVLIELHFPYNLVTSGRYGPDTTWTVDVGWQP